MAENLTSEQRAAAAAEALAAEGQSVTARAVRERTARDGSGVRMSVAAEAARRWKEAEEAARSVPDVPEALDRPVLALWRQAYTLAADAFAVERAGLRDELAQGDQERAALVADLEAADAALEEARGELRQAQDDARAAQAAAEQEVRRLTDALADERSRADRAEAGLESVAAERNRLMDALTAAATARSDGGGEQAR